MRENYWTDLKIGDYGAKRVEENLWVKRWFVSLL